MASVAPDTGETVDRCSYTLVISRVRERAGHCAVAVVAQRVAPPHSLRMVIAEREHDQATRLMESAVCRVHDSGWHRARAGRMWTPSEEFAHVLLAYDFGARAANGTMALRLERPAWMRALSRLILIPLLLRRGSFPAGGVSPEELDPLRNRAFANQVVDRDAARRTLRDLAEQTRVAFVRAATEAPERRIVHAYFGGLTLESGWRLLSAHTRHHAALLVG